MERLSSKGFIKDFEEVDAAVEVISGHSLRGKLAKGIAGRPLVLNEYEFDLQESDSWVRHILEKLDAREVDCRHFLYPTLNSIYDGDLWVQICSNCGSTLKFYDRHANPADRVRLIRFRGGEK
jgi:hypothetical protein